MLEAGRAAFLRERASLSDLYGYFDDDLTDFLTAIFVGMMQAA